MMTPATDRPACTLAIDRFSVCLECEDADVVRQLGTRYRAFLSPTATPDLTAHIDWQERRTRSGLPRDFEFQAGALAFTSIGYHGLIDLPARRAHLALITVSAFEDIDYFVRAILALQAFEAGGLLFHAAGLDRAAHGYLFFGYSGSGKTTVARLSPDAVVLNDDLVLLLPEGTGWRMAATPFSNPTQFAPAGPHHVVVSALYRLVQDRRVFVEDTPIGQAVAEIIASTPIVSADPSRAVALLARAQQLAQTVPVRRLHFLPDDSFWSVIEDRQSQR